MPATLPAWLEHYRSLPAWVLVESLADDRILWVNDRFAADNGHEREWFVGRLASEVWADAAPPSTDAMPESDDMDVVLDGTDAQGRYRWLRLQRTSLGAGCALLVCTDVSADLKLAALRLVLGRGIAGESRTSLEEGFARALLGGATLDELSTDQHMSPGQVLARLALLVSEHAPPGGSLRPAAAGVRSPAGRDLPDWVRHYEDLPVSVGLLEVPSMQVRWVNRAVLQVNGVTLGEVAGRQLRDIWADADDLERNASRAVAEGYAVDSVEVGRDLRGEQHWVVSRVTPVESGLVLVVEEDVTARLRLQAVRVLTGLHPDAIKGKVNIDDSFARLLLDGASVANICAALEKSQQDVLSTLGFLVGGRSS